MGRGHAYPISPANQSPAGKSYSSNPTPTVKVLEEGQAEAGPGMGHKRGTVSWTSPPVPGPLLGGGDEVRGVSREDWPLCKSLVPGPAGARCAAPAVSRPLEGVPTRSPTAPELSPDCGCFPRAGCIAGTMQMSLFKDLSVLCKHPCPVPSAIAY